MEESSQTESVPSKEEVSQTMTQTSELKAESTTNKEHTHTKASTHETAQNHNKAHSHEHKTHTKHASHSAAHKNMKTDETKGWNIATAILAVLLVVSLFANWDIDISKTGGSAAGIADAAAGAAEANAPSFDDFVASDYYDADTDPVLGDADAPVTIIEWSDFECPFCARAYPTVKQVEEEYVADGRVKIVFRDFPLSFHAEAQPAALAAECANEQDMFWEYHDLIFENQNLLGDAQYESWAQELGLDMNQFSDCYSSQKYASEVAEDFSDGGRLGVQGTPSFFVNGVQISGAQPYSVFEAAIEAALAAS